MPHATANAIVTELQLDTHRKPKAKTRSRDLKSLSNQLEDSQALYETSQLAQTINRGLRTLLKNTRTPISKVLSLGLGSLVVAKGQSRRLKQLTILLAIRDILQESLGISVQIYAQDPAFTRNDESFLNSLSVRILRTPSGSELGEASSVLDNFTLVYSPFLTLDAYGQLLGGGQTVPYLVGDDFDALLHKWPKHSAERVEVERVMRYGLGGCRRRAIDGDGFWTIADATFPMAMYQRLEKNSRGHTTKL
jgi:hypothetical protein